MENMFEWHNISSKDNFDSNDGRYVLDAVVQQLAILSHEGDLEKAIGYVRDAIQKEPNISYLYLLLGELLVENGQINDAVMHLQHAVALSPELPLFHYHLGEVLNAIGSRDEARKHWRTVIDLWEKATASADPELQDKYLNYGLVTATRRLLNLYPTEE